MGKEGRTIPQRTRTKETRRASYYKSLAGKPVSGTTSSALSGTSQEEKPFAGGTAYIPGEEEAPTKPVYEDIKATKYDIRDHLGILGGIIGALIFLAGIVTAYNNLTNKVDNVKTELSDYKKDNAENLKKVENDLKGDLRYTNERIDKYISKKP